MMIIQLFKILFEVEFNEAYVYLNLYIYVSYNI